ncbi:hypothetical protein JCM10213_000925 [Rhodosporidiobolus nylandii]
MSSVASSSRATRTSRGAGGTGAPSGGDDGASVASDQREDEWEGGDDDDDDEPAQPVKKKARKAAPKGKGTGKGKLAKRDEGKLKKLLELPVDILIEMAGHLDPLTLLYFTRVSKSFRAIFTSRSSMSAWLSARKNVELPDLEAEDVSEMAYAALMFEKVCNVCGKARAGVVDFQLFKRFCKGCQKDNLEADYWIPYAHKDKVLHKYLYECSFPTLKSAKQNKSKSNFYFLPNLWIINDELIDIQSRLPASSRFAVPDSNIGANGRPKITPYMSRPTVPDGSSEFREGEEELEEYVEKRRALIAAAQADAEVLEAWVKAGAAGRGNATKEAKQKRLEGIHAKLEKLGYDKQDLHTYYPEIAKLVDQPRALTDTIWKRISATIIKHVEEMRDTRLKRELSRRRSSAKFALRPYFEKTKAAYVAENPNSEDDFPPFNTFVELATVKPLWETDPAPKLDDASWAAVAPIAVEQATALTRSFKLTLAQQIVKTLEDTQHAVDSSLAVKLVAPEDADEDWTPSLTKDDLDALTKPYMRHLFCGDCPSLYSARPRPFAALWDHATSYWSGHDLVVKEPESWCIPGWADLVASALEQVGVTPAADGETALEALSGAGARWKCEGCPPFTVNLERDNKYAMRYMGASHLGHVVAGHLKTSPPVSFSIKLGSKDEQPVLPPVVGDEDDYLEYEGESWDCY